jgi:hypothetical protein
VVRDNGDTDTDFTPGFPSIKVPYLLALTLAIVPLMKRSPILGVGPKEKGLQQ